MKTALARVGLALTWALFASLALTPAARADDTETPLTLEIRSVPPLPGVRFALDGDSFESDENGVARISVAESGTYHLGVFPPEGAGIQASFSRWGDEVFVPYREVRLRSPQTLEVGFEVSYRVSQTFVDLAGQPVDARRISSLILNGSNGASYPLEDGAPRWLQADRVVRRQHGLEATPILYSVESVVVDGANVVNQSQQRFYVYPDDVWSIELLLYSARFVARDALFGFPVGVGINLEYPDGRSTYVPLGPASDVQVDSLARGIYRVSVAGAPGIAPAAPVALSRDQDVSLLVISFIDIFIAVLLGLTLVLGLLFSGRPHLFALLANRARVRRLWSRLWGASPPLGIPDPRYVLAVTSMFLLAQVGAVGLWRWVGTSTWSSGHSPAPLMVAQSAPVVPAAVSSQEPVSPPALAAAAEEGAPPPTGAEPQPTAEARVLGVSGAAHQVHLVQVGESVESIARSYGVSVQELIELNSLRPPRYAILPGQQLLVPGQVPVPVTGSQIYVVQRGDTLRKIAARFYGNASDWRRIFEANRPAIRDPDLIYRGQ